MVLDFADLDEQLADEDLGETPPSEEPGGWIANGSGDDADRSPEAQGGRAAHCAQRIASAHAIRQMQLGASEARLTRLRQKIAEEERFAAAIDDWETERTRWQRTALAEWQAANPDLSNAKPQNVRLAQNFVLQWSHVKSRAVVEVVDRDALANLVPECTETKTVLQLAEAKKLLELRNGAVVLTTTGEVLDPAVATGYTEPARTEVSLRIGDEKITIAGGKPPKPVVAPVAATVAEDDPEYDYFGDDSPAAPASTPDREFNPFDDDAPGGD